MVEPTTSNKVLIVPLTGDLSGTWGSAAVNPDFVAIDGMLGGTLTLGITTGTTILTAPVGTATSTAGPTQAQNAIIKLTGTLTGNCVVSLTLPGYYIIENACTVGAFRAIISCPTATAAVCAPPGQAVHVYTDAASYVKYVNMPAVGSFMDLCVSAVPIWITDSVPKPWLRCDGTVYNISDYPALGALLGSTFGGNGISTFGVPDLGNRYRIPLGGGRVTAGGSGINGAVLGSAGGNELMQTHNHTLTDPGHTHTYVGTQINNISLSPGGTVANQNVQAGTTGSSITGITLAAAGSGSSQNMPPALVAGITFVKT